MARGDELSLASDLHEDRGLVSAGLAPITMRTTSAPKVLTISGPAIDAIQTAKTATGMARREAEPMTLSEF